MCVVTGAGAYQTSCQHGINSGALLASEYREMLALFKVVAGQLRDGGTRRRRTEVDAFASCLHHKHFRSAPVSAAHVGVW